MKDWTVIMGVVLFGWCAGTNSAERGNPNVELVVSVNPRSGSEGHPITITFRATNRTPQTLHRMEGCGVPGGFSLTLFDPDSNRVELSRYLPRPLCPDEAVKFSPGDSTTRTLIFDGVLADRIGRDYQAQTGTYTVVAEFLAWNPMNRHDRRDATSNVQFYWNAD